MDELKTQIRGNVTCIEEGFTTTPKVKSFSNPTSQNFIFSYLFC